MPSFNNIKDGSIGSGFIIDKLSGFVGKARDGQGSRRHCGGGLAF
jgi:hypothetical protein